MLELLAGDVGQRHVLGHVVEPLGPTDHVAGEEGDGLCPLGSGRVHRNQHRVLNVRIANLHDLGLDVRGLRDQEAERSLLRIGGVDTAH
jgi:hypothetical protein